MRRSERSHRRSGRRLSCTCRSVQIAAGVLVTSGLSDARIVPGIAESEKTEKRNEIHLHTEAVCSRWHGKADNAVPAGKRYAILPNAAWRNALFIRKPGALSNPAGTRFQQLLTCEYGALLR